MSKLKNETYTILKNNDPSCMKTRKVERRWAFWGPFVLKVSRPQKCGHVRQQSYGLDCMEVKNNKELYLLLHPFYSHQRYAQEFPQSEVFEYGHGNLSDQQHESYRSSTRAELRSKHKVIHAIDVLFHSLYSCKQCLIRLILLQGLCKLFLGVRVYNKKENW